MEFTLAERQLMLIHEQLGRVELGELGLDATGRSGFAMWRVDVLMVVVGKRFAFLLIAVEWDIAKT